MFGLKKPHLHETVEVEHHRSFNPFDSDDEFDEKSTLKPLTKTSSEPSQDSYTNPFDDKEAKPASFSSGYSKNHELRNKYKNDFVDYGGIEKQSVQESEQYAAYKARETTKTVNNALKIAEDIREDATKTMVTLHQQSEQITRIHMAAADIEQDLSRGEKLLGTLGGVFSRTWKPKKGREITGPVVMRDDSAQRSSHPDHREKLGLTTTLNKGQTRSRKSTPEPTDALQKVENEKTKQDDALSDLSNILDELKEMAVDMGSEIARQNKALDPLRDDVDELDFRVRGANQRTRRLLGK